jgi:hypothetical protein
MQPLKLVGDVLEVVAAEREASTLVTDFIVLVDWGKLRLGLGMSTHVRSSSPQKSLGRSVMELKKLVRLPSVVELLSSPQMMKSISLTG